MQRQRHCIIRVDASTWIGTGHFYRCLNLALGFITRGYAISFMCRHIPEILVNILNDKNISLIELETKFDTTQGEGNNQCPHAQWLHVCYKTEIDESMHAIKHYAKENKIEKVDIIIVDHYSIEKNWHQGVKEYAKLIVQIDDLADRQHDCDVIVDQNFFPNMTERYKKLVTEANEQLLGPSYALLNHDFSYFRKKIDNYTERYNNGYIVVFFGGIDVMNETGKAVEGLLACIDKRINLDVIIGGTNPHREELQQKYLKVDNVSISVQVNNMAERFARSFLFVGAIGSTTWERCALAVPGIVVSVADNQNDLALSLNDYGSHKFIGQMENVLLSDYTQAYENLSYDDLYSMSTISSNLTDGLGVERVINKIEDRLK